MSTSQYRELRVVDLLIIVASSALGLALFRATWDSTGGGYLRHVPAPHSHWHSPYGYGLPPYFFFALYNGVPQILVAAFCVVALSMRARLTSMVSLTHSPGFLLCLAAVTASVITLLLNAPNLDWDRANIWFSVVPFWDLVVNQVLPKAGHAVFGSWVILTIAGRGRLTASLTDRIGYTLGMILLVILAFDYGRAALEYARLI